MAGVDPAIHPLRKKTFCKNDGPAGSSPRVTSPVCWSRSAPSQMNRMRRERFPWSAL